MKASFSALATVAQLVGRPKPQNVEGLIPGQASGGMFNSCMGHAGDNYLIFHSHVNVSPSLSLFLSF